MGGEVSLIFKEPEGEPTISFIEDRGSALTGKIIPPFTS